MEHIKKIEKKLGQKCVSTETYEITASDDTKVVVEDSLFE